MEKKVEVAIIGAGTAGLNVMGRVRRAGKSFILINGGHTGTTCARVGCMPSKALIQVADDYYRRKMFPRFGIEGSESLKPDLEEVMEYVREVRDTLVDRVLGGSIDTLDDDTFIDGYAEFIDANTLKVNDITIKADNIVIATGSTPVVPDAWRAFGDRVVTTDDFFEQETLPESVAVIGLGVIGLELGQAMARLGVNVTGVDMTDILSGLSDPDINQQAKEIIGKEFDLWQGAPAELEEADGKIRVSAGDNEVVVDKVLAAMGRRPNLDKLKLENLGVTLDKTGVPEYDHATQRIGDLNVYIVGDADNEKPILHEAADDGKIAAFNILAGKSVPFQRKTPLAITFTDPNIFVAGACWNELDQENLVVGQTPMGPVGRALTKAKNRGLLKIYVEKNSGKILGGAMIGVCGENLAHLVAWSVQQEKTVVDLLRMPFYHPVMEEALQGALRNALTKLEIDMPQYVEVAPIQEIATGL